MAKKKKEVSGSMIGLHGFHRVQIKEDGKIVGDSGWQGPNRFTNVGIVTLMTAIGKTTGSAQIASVGVGTGSVPATNATELPGEAVRTAVVSAVTSNRAASNGTATLQFQASWPSSICSTASRDISNIGLFNSSSGGTLFCGNTFASSNWATNQDLYASYEIRLAFAS